MSKRLVEKFIGQGDPGNDAAVTRFFDNMKTEPRLLFSIDVTHWRAIDARLSGASGEPRLKAQSLITFKNR